MFSQSIIIDRQRQMNQETAESNPLAAVLNDVFDKPKDE